LGPFSFPPRKSILFFNWTEWVELESIDFVEKIEGSAKSFGGDVEGCLDLAEFADDLAGIGVLDNRFFDLYRLGWLMPGFGFSGSWGSGGVALGGGFLGGIACGGGLGELGVFGHDMVGATWVVWLQERDFVLGVVFEECPGFGRGTVGDFGSFGEGHECLDGLPGITGLFGEFGLGHGCLQLGLVVGV
jgi:hypothetical protein